MTFKPILFSSPMVQAILEGRKTQTRRTQGLEEINQDPNNWICNQIAGLFYFSNPILQKTICIAPSKNIGDVLWVRETFFCTKYYEHLPLFKDKGNYVYKATDNFIGCHKWKPSIFMPKTACRLFLVIKNIRVERLNDINETDARAEGIEASKTFDGLYFLYGTTRNYGRITRMDYVDPIKSFHSLWQSINGPTSWVKNPWVWVIEFEKIEKPLSFLGKQCSFTSTECTRNCQNGCHENA